MDCPLTRLTYAFFQSWVRPAILPKRRTLPGSLTTCTPATLTSNMSSTALRISVLVASRRTRKVYWLWFCIASEVFSVTCGAIRMLISCSRFISWPPANSYGARYAKSLEALLDQLHRAHRHQHLVVGRERYRIECRDFDDLDVRQVARGQAELLIVRLDHDQHRGELPGLELLCEQPGLRRRQLDGVGDQQPLGARQFREHRADRAPVHLAIHLLREVARLGREGPAAADPDGRAAGAGARLTGAFLRVGLAAAAAHFGTRLLRLGTGTAGGAVGRQHLVHQGLVELRTEGAFRHLQFARAIDQLQFHGLLLSRLARVLRRCGARFERRHRLALRAARRLQRRAHDDLSALRAGHGTTDQEQISRQIDLHHAQVLGGAAHDAHVTGHATALEHPARRLTLPDGARRAVREGHSVGRGHAGEVVTLHGAGKALADGRAGDVDRLAFLEEVGLDLGPCFELGLVGLGEPELHQRLARSDIRARVVAGHGLGIQLRAAYAVGDLHGAIPVLVLRLDLGDTVRQNLDHRHRHCLAGVGEHARHAGLAADESESHLLSSHGPRAPPGTQGTLASG